MKPPKLETGMDTSASRIAATPAKTRTMLLEPQADAQRDEQDPDDQ